MVIVLFWGTVYDIGFTWVYHIRISSASFEMLLPLLGWLCTVKNRCLVPYMAGCYQTISTNPLIRRSYMRTVYLLYIYNIIVIHNIVCIYKPFYYLYIYMYVCILYLFIYICIYIKIISYPHDIPIFAGVLGIAKKSAYVPGVRWGTGMGRQGWAMWASRFSVPRLGHPPVTSVFDLYSLATGHKGIAPRIIFGTYKK